MRMINAKPLAIKAAAKEIVSQLRLYANHSTKFSADDLLKLFYAVGNMKIGSPRIRFSQNKSKVKHKENILSEGWWVNCLTRNIKQNKEHLKLKLGLVGEKMPYGSDSAVYDKRAKDKNRERFLKSKEIISKSTGEDVVLAMLEKTQRRKFSEIYCMLKEMEEYAINNDMASALITITPEASNHVSSSNYNQSTPKQINDEICKKWSKCTQAFKKLRDFYFAFRVVELHKDGTPHQHILLHCNKRLIDEYQMTLKRVFQVSSLSKGYVDWMDIDRSQGTCIGYIVKTLLPLNCSDSLEISDAERIVAARKLWNLRSYDYSGLPKGIMLAWRVIKQHSLDVTENKKAIKLLHQVKGNDFSAFVTAYLGNNITLVKANKKVIGVTAFGSQIANVKRSGSMDFDRIIEKDEKVIVNNYPRNIITLSEHIFSELIMREAANDKHIVDEPVIKRIMTYARIEAIKFIVNTRKVIGAIKNIFR